jgi:hypothetical protein
MSELTLEEKRNFHEFCDTLLSSPSAYVEICDYFKAKDSSFEYLFLFQRVKISAEIGPKALVKTIKEIRLELRAAQIAESNQAVDLQDPEVGIRLIENQPLIFGDNINIRRAI